jgi:hypothetical protein
MQYLSHILLSVDSFNRKKAKTFDNALRDIILPVNRQNAQARYDVIKALCNDLHSYRPTIRYS